MIVALLREDYDDHLAQDRDVLEGDLGLDTETPSGERQMVLGREFTHIYSDCGWLRVRSYKLALVLALRQDIVRSEGGDMVYTSQPRA